MIGYSSIFSFLPFPLFKFKNELLSLFFLSTFLSIFTGSFFVAIFYERKNLNEDTFYLGGWAKWKIEGSKKQRGKKKEEEGERSEKEIE